MAEDGEFLVCDEPGCENKIKNHRWGKIKAEGWFFTKKGIAYCPEHEPAFVKDWRKKKHG